MRKVWKKLLALLRVPWTRVVGVSVQKGMLRLACLEKEASLWRVRETLHLSADFSASEKQLWCETASALCVALSKRGWEKSCIALCLSDAQVFSYTKEFPPLSAKEMKAAVRWDLLASLPAAEAETTYCMDFQPLGGREFFLAALPRETVQEIRRAFSAAGLCLASLGVLPQTALMEAASSVPELPMVEEDVRASEDAAALWAAAGLLAPQEKRVELLPAPLRPDAWALGRVGVVFCAVCFFCMASLYGWNVWRLYELQQEAQGIEREKVLLSSERQRMESEMREGGRMAEKERQLLALSQGAMPCRSLLVHFGTRTVEGAWIRDLRVLDGHLIEIEGAAVSYDALANFVRAMEADRDFFTAAPLLKKSELRREAAGKPLVYFSLELKI